jgi:hypothetical protein
MYQRRLNYPRFVDAELHFSRVVLQLKLSARGRRDLDVHRSDAPMLT